MPDLLFEDWRPQVLRDDRVPSSPLILASQSCKVDSNAVIGSWKIILISFPRIHRMKFICLREPDFWKKPNNQDSPPTKLSVTTIVTP